MRILYIVIPLLTKLQLLNRQHPFGLSVLASVAQFPQYSLSVEATDIFSDSGTNPVQVHLLIKSGLVNEVSPFNPKKPARYGMNITVVLTITSDMDLIDFRRIPSVILLHSLSALILLAVFCRTRALTNGKSFEVIAELTKPSQTVVVMITSVS